MLPTRTRAMLLALAVSSLAWPAAPAQAAGLFDFLFGGFSSPPPRYYESEPLDLRVNPHGRKKAVSVESKPKLQTAIDPVKNPSWYLDDPTLRRGDIVVLKGRAVVYDGSRGARTMEDFTPVGRSRLVSGRDREKVETMAKGNAGQSADASPAVVQPERAAREATLR